MCQQQIIADGGRCLRCTLLPACLPGGPPAHPPVRLAPPPPASPPARPPGAASDARLTWNQRLARICGSSYHLPGQRTVASGLTTRLPQPLLCRMSRMMSSVRSNSTPYASAVGRSEGQENRQGGREAGRQVGGQAAPATPCAPTHRRCPPPPGLTCLVKLLPCIGEPVSAAASQGHAQVLDGHWGPLCHFAAVAVGSCVPADDGHVCLAAGCRAGTLVHVVNNFAGVQLRQVLRAGGQCAVRNHAACRPTAPAAGAGAAQPPPPPQLSPAAQ